MQRYFKPFCATAALAGALAVLAGFAPAARADGSTDQPISFSVDSSVKPQIGSIEIGPKSERMPVAAMADALGDQGDFVADELILATDDPGQLESFLARWHGSVIDSADPAAQGLDGLKKRYLVRIDPSLAGLKGLASNAAALAPNVGGPQRLSSDQGLRLLAAATSERLAGLDVAMNWVGYPTTIRTRVATEAPGTPNDFNWTNFCSSGTVPFISPVSCPQNIQVGEAWSELARAGVLPAGTLTLPNASRPVIAVIDSGFVATDADRPTVVNSFVSGPSSIPCSGGGACPFHGTNMVSAAMAAVNNGFGAAGVAGPVANAMLLQSGGNMFAVMTALSTASAGGARVASMSFSGQIPAAVGWQVDQLNGVAARVRASGMALVSSAGNAETDVDATSSFGLVRFENSVHWPCEASGVICVGGLGFASRSESIGSSFGAPGAGSNFGTDGRDGNSVDIWAPGVSVRVGLDPSSPGFATNPNGVQTSTGTSPAAAEVSGLVALIAAANPSLSEPAIESTLFGSAQAASITSGKSKPTGELMIAAEPAVAAALGGDRPPELRILTPASGSSYSRGLVHATASVSDDRSTPTVTWFVDGKQQAPTGTSVDLDLYDPLAFGTHQITAVAIDSHGWRTPDADGGVSIATTDDAPTMSISMPAPGAVYYTWPTYFGGWSGDRVCLQGSSSDVNNRSGRLDDSQVRWEIATNSGVVTLGGHAAGIDASALGIGTHTVQLIGIDDGQARGTASTTIEVRYGRVVRSPGFQVLC
jgi:serine protease